MLSVHFRTISGGGTHYIHQRLLVESGRVTQTLNTKAIVSVIFFVLLQIPVAWQLSTDVFYGIQLVGSCVHLSSSSSQDVLPFPVMPSRQINQNTCTGIVSHNTVGCNLLMDCEPSQNAFENVLHSLPLWLNLCLMSQVKWLKHVLCTLFWIHGVNDEWCCLQAVVNTLPYRLCAATMHMAVVLKTWWSMGQWCPQ